ncbi:MAG: M20/M25/M40 family metallo-hydrolase [Ardenticatenaceae bacterium]|nr:M20/M25/M40 family metallo-hydrolase [Ardenticatenaceae bacterium]
MSIDLLGMARAYEGEMVAFLGDLVRIRSVNGREGETAVAQRIVEEAVKLNLPAQLVAAEPERANVVVQWGEGAAGFAFIAHIDTVAEGEAGLWTQPPFAAEVVEGKMVGRGTADNKAGIAIGLYTLAMLRDHKLLDPAQVRVLVAGVVDEESGASSKLGVRYLLDEGYLPVQGAIYAYASDIVCVGHRGLLRLRLRAQGQSVHTGSAEWSRGEGGVNAVLGLTAVLLQLENLHLPAPEHPAFAEYGCTITPGTLFQGGEFESIVPAAAEALVDVRLMPGQAVAGVLTAVQRIIDEVTSQRPGLSIAMSIKNSLPAAAMAMDHPLAQIAQRHAQAITGAEWPIRGAGPANEGYMLLGAGIPTLPGFGPRGGNAHAPDEWVEVASLTATVATFAGIVRDYLGA